MTLGARRFRKITGGKHPRNGPVLSAVGKLSSVGSLFFKFCCD